MLQEEVVEKRLLDKLAKLQQDIEMLNSEKEDLELLLETTTAHATEIENELEEKNDLISQAFETLQFTQEKLVKSEKRLQREIEFGRQIQGDFLPGTLPQYDDWEINAYFLPAREISGDFYDVFELPDHLVGFVIADVCDKGVGAALFMALTRTLIRVLAIQAAERLKYIIGSSTEMYMVQVPGRKATDPALMLPAYIYEILNSVRLTNDYISENHSSNIQFATLFFGVLDVKTGDVHYVNAGHEALIHFGEDGVKGRLRSTGAAVGALPGVKYKLGHIQMQPGDVLIAYTDGATEARASDGSFYTENRLIDVIYNTYATNPTNYGSIIAGLSEDISKHTANAEPFDDITLLSLAYHKPTN